MDHWVKAVPEPTQTPLYQLAVQKSPEGSAAQPASMSHAAGLGVWQGHNGVPLPRVLWGSGCSLQVACTQETLGCVEACQCPQACPGMDADSETGAEMPCGDAALLINSSFHQHWLQPCDTPNVKQWESPAPAGDHQARSLVEDPDWARLFPCSDKKTEAISEYFKIRTWSKQSTGLGKNTEEMQWKRHLRSVLPYQTLHKL